MDKLLVAFDGSANAKRALQFALTLAQENGPIHLHIVFAHEPPILPGDVALYLSQEKAIAAQKAHSAAILAEAAQAAAAAGVAHDTAEVTGHIANAICGAAETGECQGIVMGTRGMGTISGLVLGSVANKVVHLATMPVTLVK